MHADQFRQIAEQRYFEEWPLVVADIYRVPVDTVRAWADGSQKIPSHVKQTFPRPSGL